MDPLRIACCLVLADRRGPTVVGRSDDFPFAWENAALTAVARFGPRPAGVRCPAAMFAVPVGRTHAAVVQVADLPEVRSAECGVRNVEPETEAGVGSSNPHSALRIPHFMGFRFLVLSRRLYDVLGDPFLIADRFPPDWSARGELPTLTWPSEPPPRRAADAVAAVLRDGDTALLLGGTQALLDGGRVLLVADRPADAVIRGLWQLLPNPARAELWPATFAFGPDLGFDVLAVAAPPDPWPPGYLSADQCRDYPEGRYELAVQIAAEAGDQGELDRLFARRSGREVLRAAVVLFAAAAVVAVASKVFL